MFISNLNDLNIEQENYDALVRDPLSARTVLLDSDDLDNVVLGYQHGFRIVFITLASLAAFSFFISLVFMTHKSLHRDDDEKLKREALERATKARDVEKQ